MKPLQTKGILDWLSGMNFHKNHRLFKNWMADRNMTPNNKCHNGRSRKQKRILLVDAEVIFRLPLVDGVLFVCCSVKVCGIRVQKMAVKIEYNKRRADFQLHAGKSAPTGFGHRAFQL